MTCDVDLYRANALRVLARIIDGAMLGAIERYVKQAVVDSSGQVSSAALVSATHLFERNEESKAIVKRWIGETQEATSSPNEMVQVSSTICCYLLWRGGVGYWLMFANDAGGENYEQHTRGK
jgi:coatomer protein complex subunit gamma